MSNISHPYKVLLSGYRHAIAEIDSQSAQAYGSEKAGLRIW